MATSPNMVPVGRGIAVAVEKDSLLIRVALDKAQAFDSNSGKMKLFGTTGGFQSIPGTDARLNLSVGYKS